MTHFTVVVFTKDGTEDEVARLLAPFDENDEFFREGSFWDWYVIGGRWDRAMMGEEVRTERKPCNLCGTTGTRPDFMDVMMRQKGFDRERAEAWIAECNGCNGCQGKGYREELAYPTPAGGNIMKPADIVKDFVPHGFVTPDGEYHSSGDVGWFGAIDPADDADAWPQKWMEAKGAFADTFAVLVDCHV